MKLAVYVFILLIVSCSSHQKHWGYEGETSPENWAQIHKDYQACAAGEYQTPVNLNRSKSLEHDEVVEFDYHKSPAEIINNGHTIQFNFKEKNFLKINNKKYELKQFHFHHQSEHTLGGKYYPGEMHFVHVSEDGKLAVVGLFLEYAKSREGAEKFFSKIPALNESSSHQSVDLSRFIGSRREHFYYQGSLTTPPCSENVHWIVFDQPLEIDQADFAGFTKIYPRNNRTLQAFKKHKVFHSR